MNTDHTEPRRLVPLGTLASDLGLQPRAIREAAEAGTIPCVRVGSTGLLFDRDLIERVLLKRAACPPSHADSPRACEEVSDAQTAQ